MAGGGGGDEGKLAKTGERRRKGVRRGWGAVSGRRLTQGQAAAYVALTGCILGMFLWVSFAKAPIAS